ncbi:hypothetical protein VNO77_24021 [Canavalia gladiata]|uniref:Small nuclear ribonucleoprotein E n=1 Tax=Canavalia gladiata TaxID=3824 RepID=A0AAN9QC34_CANGL
MEGMYIVCNLGHCRSVIFIWKKSATECSGSAVSGLAAGFSLRKINGKLNLLNFLGNCIFSHIVQSLGFSSHLWTTTTLFGQIFAAMASTKVQRVMTQPINLIFRFLQSKARIQIWLFEQKDMRIEGRIIGFDEYMNLVLDDAEEVNIKKKSRKTLGRILLKGDNITLMMNTGK